MQEFAIHEITFRSPQFLTGTLIHSIIIVIRADTCAKKKERKRSGTTKRERTSEAGRRVRSPVATTVRGTPSPLLIVASSRTPNEHQAPELSENKTWIGDHGCTSSPTLRRETHGADVWRHGFGCLGFPPIGRRSRIRRRRSCDPGRSRSNAQ